MRGAGSREVSGCVENTFSIFLGRGAEELPVFLRAPARATVVTRALFLRVLGSRVARTYASASFLARLLHYMSSGSGVARGCIGGVPRWFSGDREVWDWEVVFDDRGDGNRSLGMLSFVKSNFWMENL